MSNLFQIGDSCQGLGPIVAIIKKGLFPIVQVGIPLVLVALGTVDLGKAVISSDEKEVKQAQGRLIKRCIYAVAIFFVVTLVTIVMNLVATGASEDKNIAKKDTTSWKSCWDSI